MEDDSSRLTEPSDSSEYSEAEPDRDPEPERDLDREPDLDLEPVYVPEYTKRNTDTGCQDLMICSRNFLHLIKSHIAPEVNTLTTVSHSEIS